MQSALITWRRNAIGKHGVVRHASSEAAAHQPNLSDIGLHLVSTVSFADNKDKPYEINIITTTMR